MTKTFWLSRNSATDFYVLHSKEPALSFDQTYVSDYMIRSFCPRTWNKFTGLKFKAPDKREIEISFKFKKGNK